ncbi:MAG: hypothetical protein WCK05_08720, partial [Planctomycetota bacterium]
MTNTRKTVAALAAMLAVASVLCAPAARGAELKLLPTPKSIQVTGGQMLLTAASRIVATDPKLKGLAEILSGEILLI